MSQSATQQMNQRIHEYRAFRVIQSEYGSFNVPAINCFGASSVEDAHRAIDASIARSESRNLTWFKTRDFCEQHQHASEIVVDTETGLPFKAVYSGPTCNGVLRVQDAVYYFADHWGGVGND